MSRLSPFFRFTNVVWYGAFPTSYTRSRFVISHIRSFVRSLTRPSRSLARPFVCSLASFLVYKHITTSSI